MTKKQKRERTELVSLAVLFVAVAAVNALISLPWWGEALAFGAVYLAAGHGVLWSAVRNILRGQIFDEKFLMALATVGALLIGEYPEAVFVMLFFRTGELFEKVAVGNSRKSIAALTAIRPDTARVLREGVLTEVEAASVKVGEQVVVHAGERIPLDGIITEGESALDLSALTGESLPADKRAGDTVMSGSIVLNGTLTLEVTHSFETSTASRILELVENSTLHKAPVENFITRFAKYYTPAVVLAALLTALLPPLFVGGWSIWLHRALVFLVVSCPCALVISVPLTFFSGIGGASKQGILVKGAAHLEKLSAVGAVVFDKTGTLTHGNFAVSGIYPAEVSEQELLEVAALAESHSDHPIALSLKTACGKTVEHHRISRVTEQAGFGVSALLDGKRVVVGNLRLMEQEGIDLTPLQEAGTAVYVAREGKFLGAILISDTLKESARAAVSALKKEGFATVMLTGDRREIGEKAAGELGLDEVVTDLLPADKVERLLSLKERYGAVAYVGDGINDAPVLSTADVGVAMGALGSDAAIEAADIVLMQDDPLQVSRAVNLSRRVRSIVRQNIIFALGVKFAVMALSLFGYENMWLAGFADVGVSVIAILNAVRALKITNS